MINLNFLLITLKKILGVLETESCVSPKVVFIKKKKGFDICFLKSVSFGRHASGNFQKLRNFFFFFPKARKLACQLSTSWIWNYLMPSFSLIKRRYESASLACQRPHFLILEFFDANIFSLIKRRYDSISPSLILNMPLSTINFWAI